MSDMIEFFNSTGGTVLASVLPTILAALGIVWKLFGSRITLWIQGKLIEPLTKLIRKLAPTVIASVDQSFVDELRKLGQWTSEHYQEAMDRAYERLQAMLTVKQWALLEKLVDISEVKRFVTNIIQQVLRDSKPTAKLDTVKSNIQTGEFVGSINKRIGETVSNKPTATDIL